MIRTLRVFDLTAEQQARFGVYYLTGDKAMWEDLYAEQQADDALRAERIRDAYKAGEIIAATPFNERVLGLEARSESTTGTPRT